MASARALRVGILVECGRGGLEDVLCRRICELLRQQIKVDFEIDIVPMDNKARLIQDCGTVAARLLDDGCRRVVILWDERPAWPKIGEPLCWHNDRQSILANLHRAEVANRPVYLVCIEREFEILVAVRSPDVVKCLVDGGPSRPGRLSAQPPPDAESQRHHDQPVASTSRVALRGRAACNCVCSLPTEPRPTSSVCDGSSICGAGDWTEGLIRS